MIATEPVTRIQIIQWADQIAERFQPERIILFGSHAYGTPTPDSDVDVLVTLRHTTKNTAKAIEILNAIRPPFPVDLLVRTPDEVAKRVADGDFFLREITQRGQVLYDAAHSRVG